jgi:hypothetical protein
LGGFSGQRDDHDRTGCVYQWPSPDPKEHILKLRQQAEYLYNNTDYALVGSAVIGGGIFEQPARTMGCPIS